MLNLDPATVVELPVDQLGLKILAVGTSVTTSLKPSSTRTTAAKRRGRLPKRSVGFVRAV